MSGFLLYCLVFFKGDEKANDLPIRFLAAENRDKTDLSNKESIGSRL